MISLEPVWVSGIIAGLFFILNFTTCYSMPWAKKCDLVHKCKGKQCTRNKKMLCQHHKPLAWLTIATGAFHIIISILWYFGV